MADGDERRAAFNELVFQFRVNGLDHPFFRGVDGLGIALARQSGEFRPWLFFPGAFGAVHGIALSERFERDDARVARRHLDHPVWSLFQLFE